MPELIRPNTLKRKVLFGSNPLYMVHFPRSEFGYLLRWKNQYLKWRTVPVKWKASGERQEDITFSSLPIISANFFKANSTRIVWAISGNNNYRIIDNRLIGKESRSKFATFGKLRIRSNGQVTLEIYDGGPASNRTDLSDEFEIDGYIKIETAEHTLIIPIDGKDRSDPYTFNPSNRNEVRQFFGNYKNAGDGSTSATITLGIYL